MKPYSVDLREWVVGAVLEKGWTWEQAAETFGVSVSSVSRFLAAHRAGRSLVPQASSGRPRLLRLAEHVKALREHLEDEPDAEISQRCAPLAATEGIFVSVPTLGRATRALGWTRKKDLRRGGTGRDRTRGVALADGVAAAPMRSGSSWTKAVPTRRWLPATATRPRANARTAGCLATAGATLRSSRP